MNLIIEKKEKILIVKLNRAETKNALDPATLLDLWQVWEDFKADNNLVVAILASALEDSFSSGMDLNSTIPIFTGVRPPKTDAERKVAENPMILQEAMLRIPHVGKPIIAAIHGYCLTGGFEMAMGADLRIASADAVFQMREAKLGLMPTSGATVRLPRMIPLAAAMEILLTAAPFSATQMLEWGFLNQVVSREELMPAALELAETIAKNGPLAIRSIMQSVYSGMGLSLEAALAKEMEIGLPVFMSEDAKEGPRAFKEKRPPKYQGK